MAKETYRNVRKNNFTMVGNALLNDSAITLQAKGLLSILISNDTDKFKINMKEIISRSKNGRDAQYKVIDELIKNGYYARVEIRVDGKFDELVYIFSDDKEDVAEALKEYAANPNAIINPDKKRKNKGDKQPVPENQDTVKSPVPENQDTEIQDTENADTVFQDNNNMNLNNTNSNNTNHNNTKSLSNDPLDILETLQANLREGVFNEFQTAWNNLKDNNVDMAVLGNWLLKNNDTIEDAVKTYMINELVSCVGGVQNTAGFISYKMNNLNNGRKEMLPEWLNKKEKQEDKPKSKWVTMSDEEFAIEKARLEAELKNL